MGGDPGGDGGGNPPPPDAGLCATPISAIPRCTFPASHRSKVRIPPEFCFMFYFHPSGMMIESMAGKSSSLHCLCHDATPFTFSEDQPAVDYFGQLLRAGKSLGRSNLPTL